ncbi:purine-cytosine permease family protein [Alicyclobacillus dauci]|uniref:Cytosine permease n=1 Tax=Alicyclobacillus dauci TaxID=1475485 RepID=A0ABY6Z467_9BACL|nr:cytosine permease [Alicyclobacillus dauci]WAH37554.1 cytosine permease [Alicyclobacillus dauci]
MANSMGGQSGVETHGIDHIQEEDRHGSPRSLFTIWSSTNLTVAAFTTGGLSIQLGLGLWSSFVAMIIGIALGAVLIAVMSRTGWELGIPQMLMTRPTFGRIGAILPVVIVWVNFLGWFTILDVLGAQALHAGFGLSMAAGIIILAAITVFLGVYGNTLVQAAEKWIAILGGIIFIVVAILAIPHVNWSYAGDPKVTGSNWWGAIVMVAAVAFSYAGPGYTPYASDYTRYLPRSTKFRSIFGATFWGMTISCTFIFCLGAAVLTTNPTGDPMQLIVQLTGPFSKPALCAMALGTIGAGAMNIYSGGLTALVSGIKVNRWVSALAIGVVGTLVAVWAQAQIEVKYENYLMLVLYTIPPMDAIFIMDFFFIRKRRYTITDFYNNGFPAFHFAGWVSYLVGIIISIPFMSSALYTGPIAKYFHGADISYVISIVVTGGLYFLLKRKSLVTVPDLDPPSTEGALPM